MEQTAHLWLFAAMVFGIVLLPGLDMAFVMASSVAGGRRNGGAALAGIVAGGVCHVLMGALGVAAILQLLPMAFNLVLLAGAAYIAWIGLSLMRSHAAFDELGPQAARSRMRTFRQGMLTCLLNPKAYLFMLAVFPQFLKPEYGGLWVQTAVLGTIVAVAQVAVYGAVALAGDRLRAWMRGNPGANTLLMRIVGGLLVATALYTAYEGWRGLA